MTVTTVRPRSAASQLAEYAPWPLPAPMFVIRVAETEVRLQAGQSCTIGRDPECDIVITDSRVSRRHAVARSVPNGWIFQDAGSANGTFFGSSRVDRLQVITDCLFRLGDPQGGPEVLCSVVRPEPDGADVPAPRAAGPSPDRPTVTMHRAPVRVRRIHAAGDRAGAWLRSKAPARPPVRTVGLATATSLAGLVALAAIGVWLRQPLLIPPLAASMALIAASPALPLAQPRNVIAGQLIAALVGFAALAMGGPGIWTAAAAGGLALAAMLLLRAAHSPAAATAVIVGATAPPAGRFLVLLAAATAILVAFGVLGARIEGKKYPLYWW